MEDIAKAVLEEVSEEANQDSQRTAQSSRGRARGRWQNNNWKGKNRGGKVNYYEEQEGDEHDHQENDDDWTIYHIDSARPVEVGILLNNERAAGLVDTGAMVNVLSAEMWSKLKAQDNTLAMQPCNKILKTAGDKQVNIIGTVSLPLRCGQLQHKANFRIVEQTTRVILGRDQDKYTSRSTYCAANES